MAGALFDSAPGCWISGYHPGHKDQFLDVYRWLFRTARKNAQDIRIHSLLELEAFLEIHRSWKRLGYPFDMFVPSLASAIGSSADRPGALAELMGTIHE